VSYTNVVTRYDEVVIPYTSGYLAPADRDERASTLRPRFALVPACLLLGQDQVAVAELVPEVAVVERGGVAALEQVRAGGGLEQAEV
jgi:hypothetical protein